MRHAFCSQCLPGLGFIHIFWNTFGLVYNSHGLYRVSRKKVANAYKIMGPLILTKIASRGGQILPLTLLWRVQIR